MMGEEAHEARQELSHLLDELFVNDLRAKYTALVKQTQDGYEELKRKQETQTNKIAQLETCMKRFQEEDLPEQLGELPKLTTLKATEQALSVLFRESQAGMTERLTLLHTELGGDAAVRMRDLISILMDHQQSLLGQSEAAFSRTFTQAIGQVAAAEDQTRGVVGELLLTVRQLEQRGKRLLVITVALLGLLTLLSGAIALRLFGA